MSFDFEIRPIPNASKDSELPLPLLPYSTWVSSPSTPIEQVADTGRNTNGNCLAVQEDFKQLNYEYTRLDLEKTQLIQVEVDGLEQDPESSFSPEYVRGLLEVLIADPRLSVALSSTCYTDEQGSVILFESSLPAPWALSEYYGNSPIVGFSYVIAGAHLNDSADSPFSREPVSTNTVFAVHELATPRITDPELLTEFFTQYPEFAFGGYDLSRECYVAYTAVAHLEMPDTDDPYWMIFGGDSGSVMYDTHFVEPLRLVNVNVFPKTVEVTVSDQSYFLELETTEAPIGVSFTSEEVFGLFKFIVNDANLLHTADITIRTTSDANSVTTAEIIPETIWSWLPGDNDDWLLDIRYSALADSNNHDGYQASVTLDVSASVDFDDPNHFAVLCARCPLFEHASYNAECLLYELHLPLALYNVTTDSWKIYLYDTSAISRLPLEFSIDDIQVDPENKLPFVEILHRDILPAPITSFTVCDYRDVDFSTTDLDDNNYNKEDDAGFDDLDEDDFGGLAGRILF
ncbi:MAG: hypothetical protein R3B92_03135 [Patescibacteria group bacterium]